MIERSTLRLIAASALAIACLSQAAFAAPAETAAGTAQAGHLPLSQIFLMLFLMLGPFKIIAPFAAVTKGAESGLVRKIAVLSVFVSSIAVLLAAALGERILASYGISVTILALTAGIILFLVALLAILRQFAPPTAHDGEPASAAPTMRTALTPLAFPTIVTPYGIAALIVFLAFSPDLQSKLSIVAVVLAIMVLNLIVMLTSKRFLKVLGVVLPVLGAVLGVVQVAVGLQIIYNALGSLGVY